MSGSGVTLYVEFESFPNANFMEVAHSLAVECTEHCFPRGVKQFLLRHHLDDNDGHFSRSRDGIFSVLDQSIAGPDERALHAGERPSVQIEPSLDSR